MLQRMTVTTVMSLIIMKRYDNDSNNYDLYNNDDDNDKNSDDDDDEDNTSDNFNFNCLISVIIML